MSKFRELQCEIPYLLETQEEFLGEEIVQLQLRSVKMSLYVLERRGESCFMRLLSFVRFHVELLN